MPACPICKKAIASGAPRASNAAFPFCSARCRQVDLGNWLSESYRVPAEPSETEDEGEDAAVQSKLEDA